MCGIAGILATRGTRVDRADLALLAEAIAHRGPDGEGLWLSADENVGLVHRRLAIIDTSGRGHQPMRSGDGRYTIVFNGEIFNFLELRSELVAAGSSFVSDSDTEVILAAWQHWGESMLTRFNGMWALAIHDSVRGEVFLARDRFGVKPLLYAEHAGRIAFASEMRALRRLAWVDRGLDPDVVRRLLFDPFGIEGSERSITRSIRRLPAGHCAIWRDGTLSVRRWWRTVDHLVEVPATFAQQAERFHELFVDAIRLRMRSDVPVGTCLSGGFDSSAIVCAMAEVGAASQPRLREASDWRHAFIASFPGRSNDETPMALEAATYASVRPHLLNLSEVGDAPPIDTVIDDLDDIYISLPAAPWEIYRELRRQRTLVSLDGHGADELMGGYRQQGQALGFELRNRLARLASRSSRVRAAIDDLKIGWLSTRGLNFLRDHRLRAPAEMTLPGDADRLPDHWGALNRRLYRMFHSTVLPTILRNFDRLSMAHGVEVRMPFMDWRLVIYVMSLPDSAKVAAIGSKAVAREAMAGRMPESIRTSQRKVGFNSPMPEWLNGALGHWAIQVLGQANDEFDSLVDRGRLLARVRQLTAQGRWNWENSSRLWPYVNLLRILPPSR